MAEPSSSQMDVVPVAASTMTQRQYYHCLDDASIRNLVKVLAQERSHILQALGSTYREFLHSVGFCQAKPVQILSPFDIQPGSLRREFLENFTAVSGGAKMDHLVVSFKSLASKKSCVLSHSDNASLSTPFFPQLEASGNLKDMPYLVYWFEQSLLYASPHVTLEPCASVWSFEDGEKLSYDRIPRDIEKKMLTNQALTADEKLVCKAFSALDAARKSGSPAVIVQPDEEVYKVIRAPTSTAGVQTESTTNASTEQPRLPPKQKNMPVVGQRIKVMWDQSLFYYGVVKSVRDDFYFIVYDDEETQWLPLADHKFKIVPQSERSKEALPTRAPNPRWNMDTPGKADVTVKDRVDESLSAQKAKDGKGTRIFRNGYWIPKTPSKKDAKGFFNRPPGRPPKGFEWE